MGWFSRLKSKSADSAEQPEQAVIVEYSLVGASEVDRPFDSVSDLEDQLIAAIEAAGAGEFDGNLFGPDEVTLYAYGPDADRLFAVMEPRLREFPARPARATLRYGAASDPAAAERSIDL